MTELRNTSIRMPDWMVDELDRLEEQNKYYSRSDAVRSAVEKLIEEHDGEVGERPITDTLRPPEEFSNV